MNEGQMKIGINGLGRIGKLTVWHHVGRRYFKEIVVNIGRQAGTGLSDIAHYLERDSTYGALHTFLHGYQAKPVITDIDDSAGTMVVDGITVTAFAYRTPPPGHRLENGHGVRLVVDTTGQFLDPYTSRRPSQRVGPGAPGSRRRKSGGIRPLQDKGRRRPPCPTIRSRR